MPQIEDQGERFIEGECIAGVEGLLPALQANARADMFADVLDEGRGIGPGGQADGGHQIFGGSLHAGRIEAGGFAIRHFAQSKGKAERV